MIPAGTSSTLDANVPGIPALRLQTSRGPGMIPTVRLEALGMEPAPVGFELTPDLARVLAVALCHYADRTEDVR